MEIRAGWNPGILTHHPHPQHKPQGPREALRLTRLPHPTPALSPFILAVELAGEPPGPLDEPHVLQSPTEGSSPPALGWTTGTHGPCQTETPTPGPREGGLPQGPRSPKPALCRHLGALLQAAAQLLQALGKRLSGHREKAAACWSAVAQGGTGCYSPSSSSSTCRAHHPRLMLPPAPPGHTPASSGPAPGLSAGPAPADSGSPREIRDSVCPFLHQAQHVAAAAHSSGTIKTSELDG